MNVARCDRICEWVVSVITKPVEADPSPWQLTGHGNILQHHTRLIAIYVHRHQASRDAQLS